MRKKEYDLKKRREHMIRMKNAMGLEYWKDPNPLVSMFTPPIINKKSSLMTAKEKSD